MPKGHATPLKAAERQQEAASVFASRELQSLAAMLLLYILALQQIRTNWKESDIQRLRGEIESRFPEASEFPIWERLYRVRSKAPGRTEEKQVETAIASTLDAFERVQEKNVLPSEKQTRAIAGSVGNVGNLLRRYVELKKVAQVS